MTPCIVNLDAEQAIFRVSAPDGTSMLHQGLSVALKAARNLMFIAPPELDRASAALRGGGTRHIFTYGFASTWVERIEGQAVKLKPSFIGAGPKLFHVSLLADVWPSPTAWLVAASDLDAAFDIAMQQYPDYDRADFDDGRDGYEIGEFVI